MRAPTLALFLTTLGILTLLSSLARADDVTVTLDAASGFVIEDNAATIQRLRVDEATGNISRNGALFVHTTGTDSTYVGEAAGNSATTGLMKGLGYGKGYRYAHNEPDAFVPDANLPEALGDTEFYHPTERGPEADFAQRLERLRSRRRAASSPDDEGNA